MLPLEAVFQALNDQGARYILVGGLAVVLHGHLRATGDLDLIVDFRAGEVEKTLIALDTAGFRPYAPVPIADFANPVTRASWTRDKGMLVFSLRPDTGVPVVDLFLEHPVPFDELWARSVVTPLRGVPIRVASIDDLVTLKRMAGRPEDLADAEALLEIKRIRAEGSNS